MKKNWIITYIAGIDSVHTGPFMGIAPTGKTFADVPLHITYRLAGGKIVDHWMMLDNADLMQKLGLVPSAA